MPELGWASRNGQFRYSLKLPDLAIKQISSHMGPKPQSPHDEGDEALEGRYTVQFNLNLTFIRISHQVIQQICRATRKLHVSA